MTQPVKPVDFNPLNSPKVKQTLVGVMSEIESRLREGARDGSAVITIRSTISLRSLYCNTVVSFGYKEPKVKGEVIEQQLSLDELGNLTVYTPPEQISIVLQKTQEGEPIFDTE